MESDEKYNRIVENKPFDYSFKVFTKLELYKLIKYFETIEEYEKCQFIKDFIDNRFDHKKNYYDRL